MRISTSHIFNQNLTSMLNQQAELSRTQQQLSTGKRILNPSDDPAGSVEILNLQREFNLMEQNLANADKAENKLVIEEGVLESSTNILQRVRELAIQGLNDTNSLSERSAIAQEMNQLNEQLLGLANTRDSSGNYIFSGFKNDVQPYASISAAYDGDSGQRNMQVGVGVLVETNDPGNEVFEAQHIQTRVADNNAPPAVGPVSSSQINITATAQQGPIDFPITLTYDSVAGELTITDAAVPANTATVNPYIAGQSIELNQLDVDFPDLTVQLDGTLADGDSYTIDTQVTPAQTLFRTINDFATALSTNSVGSNDSPNNGEFLTNISTAMETIVGARAELGARMNGIDQQRQVNEGISFNMEKTISSIQDLDYAEAISRLTQQSTGLQAAQQSFARVQNLSLFNFL